MESLPLGVTNMILLLLGASGGLKQTIEKQGICYLYTMHILYCFIKWLKHPSSHENKNLWIKLGRWRVNPTILAPEVPTRKICYSFLSYITQLKWSSLSVYTRTNTLFLSPAFFWRRLGHQWMNFWTLWVSTSILLLFKQRKYGNVFLLTVYCKIV